MPSLSLLLCVAAGGAAGAVLRWLTGFFLAQNLGTDWPYGTMAVNLSGSFLIGFLSVLLLQKYPDPRLAAFLIAGFLGGLTTFSSFINEGLQFLLAGRPETGLLYMAGETAAGLAAAALGVFFGRFFV